MENANPHGEPARRLKELLKTANLTSFRLDRTRRATAFAGRTRDWTVVARLTNEWLHLYAYVCELPAESTVRARLLEATMRLNQQMHLAKFVCADGLYLELDYRAEHLDPALTGRLAAHLHENAEETYPRIFRIVSGDETLRALEASLVRPAAQADA